MKKIVKSILIIFCLINLVGCFNNQNVEYDSVQITLMLSSTTAGQPKKITDSKVIYELWGVCQESNGELGDGEKWKIKFVDSKTNKEENYVIFESQKEVYEEVTKIYNEYFNSNN